ncbi:hypothetical protein D9M68_538580 [compost metagenome]
MLHHRPGRFDFGSPMRRGRFHIQDHAVVGFDQVVGGAGKVGRATWYCGPPSLRIGERNPLEQSFRQRLFIEGFEVLAHGAGAARRIWRVPDMRREVSVKEVVVSSNQSRSCDQSCDQIMVSDP